MLCDAAPCFGGVPIPGSAQGTGYHLVGTEGRMVGERGGASHGGTADSTWALVDAAEIYHIIIFIMLILCCFIP